jgi:hypothetical protein
MKPKLATDIYRGLGLNLPSELFCFEQALIAVASPEVLYGIILDAELINNHPMVGYIGLIAISAGENAPNDNSAQSGQLTFEHIWTMADNYLRLAEEPQVA